MNADELHGNEALEFAATLAKIATDPDRWEVVYLDLRSGRRWVLDYPHGHLQGGGPPRLRRSPLNMGDSGDLFERAVSKQCGGGYDADRVRERLGLALPDDYAAFVTRYGACSICDFLNVFAPGHPNLNLDVFNQATVQAAVLETMRSERRAAPYPGFPKPGGLLPWGMTGNGDTCFWRTGDPNPNHWEIVLCDGRGVDWERHATTMTAFLSDILSRRLRTGIFPDDFP